MREMDVIKLKYDLYVAVVGGMAAAQVHLTSENTTQVLQNVAKLCDDAARIYYAEGVEDDT